jgi:hypothetical protein
MQTNRGHQVKSLGLHKASRLALCAMAIAIAKRRRLDQFFGLVGLYIWSEATLS